MCCIVTSFMILLHGQAINKAACRVRLSTTTRKFPSQNVRRLPCKINHLQPKPHRITLKYVLVLMRYFARRRWAQHIMAQNWQNFASTRSLPCTRHMAYVAGCISSWFSSPKGFEEETFLTHLPRFSFTLSLSFFLSFGV